jgi:mannosyltransferase OCH1-like enzyme
MEEENLDIPKNIFQTHKSSAYVNSNTTLKSCLSSWTKYKPSYNHFFSTNETCENFIKEQFPGNVYDAYCRLPLAVMKADLWRYCVIYKYGGIYADADAMCLVNPDLFTLPKTLLVCGPENETHLCQWFFAAPKESPILKSIIDLSTKRILETPEIKGEHIVHHLTGPGCFTDGIEEFLRNNNLQTFDNKKMYESYRNDLMCVFNCDNFRNKIIRHYFAGQQPDGWFEKRKRVLS